MSWPPGPSSAASRPAALEPFQNVLGPAAARLPPTVNLGSTAAVKEAVHAGLGISLVLRGAADADRRAGRLHTLAIDGPPFRKALWLAHRGALVPEDQPPW